MILRRALWIENFEDGTFEDYWDSTEGGSDDCDIFLQRERFIKDGSYSLKVVLDLATSGAGTARKRWTTPQLDLTNYSRIYYWGYSTSTTTGEVRIRLRNDGSWGSYLVSVDDLETNVWTLAYVNLSGTRDKIDGIELQFEETRFGDSPFTVYIDTIVATRSDTNHTFDFTTTQEERFNKSVRADLLAYNVSGRNISQVESRGYRARGRVLQGELTSLSQRQSIINMLRSGTNLYLLSGLGAQHAIVVRVIDRQIQLLPGTTGKYPYVIGMIESLEAPL